MVRYLANSTCLWLDHPRSAIVGISSVLKFGLDPIYSFGDVAIFIFCCFGLKLPTPIFGGFGAYFAQIWSTTVLTPKRRNHVWAIKRENRFGSTWTRSREKKDRTGQDSQTKKSQSGNISPIWEEAPIVGLPIRTKICMVCRLPDVITYAKFQVEIFRGYDFTVGRISHFPIDFCMGLTTVQRDCAACY